MHGSLVCPADAAVTHICILIYIYIYYNNIIYIYIYIYIVLCMDLWYAQLMLQPRLLA